jgi:hypothetical protein
MPSTELNFESRHKVNLEDVLAKYLQFSSLINNGDEITGKVTFPLQFTKGNDSSEKGREICITT